jgi:hypothetical protein
MFLNGLDFVRGSSKITYVITNDYLMKGFKMSKFVVVAGSRPKRACAGVYVFVAGKQTYEMETVAYYETNCSMWDECDCCSFDDDANISTVLASAGVALTGETIFIADENSMDGGRTVLVAEKI